MTKLRRINGDFSGFSVVFCSKQPRFPLGFCSKSPKWQNMIKWRKLSVFSSWNHRSQPGTQWKTPPRTQKRQNTRNDSEVSKRQEWLRITKSVKVSKSTICVREKCKSVSFDKSVFFTNGCYHKRVLPQTSPLCLATTTESFLPGHHRVLSAWPPPSPLSQKQWLFAKNSDF